MTAIEQTFDNIPITVPGVYRYRNDRLGEMDIRIEIRDGCPMSIVKTPQMTATYHFPVLSYQKGAGWYFKSPLPES